VINSTSRTAMDVRRTKNMVHPRSANGFELGFSESDGTGGAAVDKTRPLTRREQQIADLLLQGYENAEIAEQLGITRRTVKAHFNRLFLRFGIVGGIKRVKLATLLYRKRLSSDAVGAGREAQLSGSAASLPSIAPRASTIASLEKLGPRSILLRTVFEPCSTSWECGTVSSMHCSTRQVAVTRRVRVARGA
jgi:DNA-binding CsgD family transcriptional regulator